MFAIIPKGNEVTYWPVDIGESVTYSVSSGFCTQTYEGIVIDIVEDQALVEFDHGTEWIEERYLTILAPKV